MILSKRALLLISAGFAMWRIAHMHEIPVAVQLNDGSIITCTDDMRQPVIKQVSTNPIDRPIVEPSQHYALKTTQDTCGPSVAMCIILKNELRYLNEFLDYYIVLGVSAFFLYDNHNELYLPTWLDQNRPGWNRYIQVHHQPGLGHQAEAMHQCGTKIARDQYNHTWGVFFDSDEYLVLHQHDNLVHFLQDTCQSGSVSVNWYNYGPDMPFDVFDPTDALYKDMNVHADQQVNLSDKVHHTEEELFQQTAHLAPNGLPRPLIQRNRRRSSYGWYGWKTETPPEVKSLTRLQDILKIDNPHFPKLKRGTRRKTPTGAASPAPLESCGEHIATLNHYRYKSLPEYLFKKCIRGPGRKNILASSTCENFQASTIRPGVFNSFRQHYDDRAWEYLKSKIPWYRQFG